MFWSTHLLELDDDDYFDEGDGDDEHNQASDTRQVPESWSSNEYFILFFIVAMRLSPQVF